MVHNRRKHESRISLVYGAAAFILLLVCFFGIKEKVTVEVTEKKEDRPSIKDSFKSVSKYKYFYLLIVLFIIGNLGAGYGAVGPYYARDVLGDMSYFGTNTVIVILPTLVAILIMPKIFQRFGKRKTILAGYIVTFLATLLILLDTRNVPLYYGANIIRAFGVAPFTVASFTLAADLADFGEWKSGIRAEGFVYGCTSFGMKFGTGIGSGILGLVLSVGGYSAAAAAAGKPQSTSSLNSMVFLNLIMPLIVYTIQFTLVYFWDMDKIFGQVQKDLAIKRQKEHELSEAK